MATRRPTGTAERRANVFSAGPSPPLERIAGWIPREIPWRSSDTPVKPVTTSESFSRNACRSGGNDASAEAQFVDVSDIRRGRILVAVSPGDAARLENHCRDGVALDRKSLTDRYLFLRPTVVVAGEQNPRTVGLITDQSCVSDSEAQ